MSWISAPDAVRALLFLLERPEISGPINITAPAPVTNAAFTKALAVVLHRPAIIPVPAFVLRLLLGEMADGALLSSTRALPAKLLASGFSFGDPEIGPALTSMLGR
jgi:NAD dependent epimerase/dehydratase family enzyme